MHEDDGVMKRPTGGRAAITGWGADLEYSKRPAVPMHAPSDVNSLRGPVGDRQVPTVRIHKSPEHPDLTPVFGTTCPPRGLSGMVRDVAYRFSEGRQVHWLTLMLADRIDIVEGMIEDVTHGRAPRIRQDHAGPEYHTTREQQRKNLMLTAAGLGVAAGMAILMARSREPRRAAGYIV